MPAVVKKLTNHWWCIGKGSKSSYLKKKSVLSISLPLRLNLTTEGIIPMSRAIYHYLFISLVISGYWASKNRLAPLFIVKVSAVVFTTITIILPSPAISEQ